MAPRLAVVCTILLGLGLACEAPAYGQSAQPPQGGNVTTTPNIIIPPDLLPDLVVSSASVKATCVNKKTVTAEIVATVKNQSPKGTADLTKVAWQIILGAEWWSTSGPINLEPAASQTVKPLVGGPKMLAPGATWTGKLAIAGIPRFKKSIAKQGEYGFQVVADPGKNVGESNEKNNEKLIYAADPCFKL